MSAKSSTRVTSGHQEMPTTTGYALESSLGDGYSPAVQVLLQTLVEFCEPPKLQLGH